MAGRAVARGMPGSAPWDIRRRGAPRMTRIDLLQISETKLGNLNFLQES